VSVEGCDRTYDLDDLDQLVHVALSRKQWLPQKQLRKHAPGMVFRIHGLGFSEGRRKGHHERERKKERERERERKRERGREREREGGRDIPERPLVNSGRFRV
jgi:hypothetical protein